MNVWEKSPGYVGESFGIAERLELGSTSSVHLPPPTVEMSCTVG